MNHIKNVLIRNTYEYFKKSGGYGCIEQVLATFRALSYVIEIYFTEKLFESITGLYNNSLAYADVMHAFVRLIVILVCIQIMDGVGRYLFSKVSYSNMGKFMVDFQSKLSELPAHFFEDADFLNNLEKAKECVEYEELGHFASRTIQFFTYYLVYFFSIGYYLFLIDPRLILIILFSFVPSVLGQIIQVASVFEMQDKLALLRRKKDYYEKSIASREYFKETRMLGAFRYLFGLYKDSLFKGNELKLKLQKRVTAYKLALDIITFIGFAGSIILLYFSIRDGQISIAAFSAVLISLSQIFGITNEMVTVYFTGGVSSFVEVANFYNIMNLNYKNEPISDTHRNIDMIDNDIILDNISYAYPGSDEESIKNVSFEIKKGEVIGIVGANGSGKSTLVRNMIGLYVPNKGDAFINGLNTKNNKSGDIFKGSSAVFQSFIKYKLSLSDNIRISDIYNDKVDELVNNKLIEAGFDNANVKLDTMLSPEFSGGDLSGGEWQRIAIARGLYRDHNIIVLDEPSASIDPVRESEIYESFRRLVKGKTTILITHRLGAVKLTDRIIVMDKGEIIGFGTHEELLAKCALYKEMWTKQSAWYE